MGEREIKVYLSKENTDPADNSIVISPSHDNFNNFGYQIRCDFSLNVNSIYHSGVLFFGFIPDSKSDEVLDGNDRYLGLRQWFRYSDKKETVFSKNSAPEFFTLLPDMQSYRSLVDKFGVRIASLILANINDIVVRKDDGKSSEWMKRVRSLKVFTHGFMRNSEPFFVYHNAGNILGGVEEEKFDSISSKLTLKFQIDGFLNQHEINFKHAGGSIIPKRINILIGKNGVGKSQSLSKFCRSALRYKGEENNLKEEFFSRPMINRLLAIGTPGETSNTFPAERIKTQKLFYRRLNLTRNSREKESKKISDLLVQIARSDDLIGKRYRWDIFWTTLEKALDAESIVMRLIDGSYCKIKDLWNVSGEEKKLALMSNIDVKGEPKFCLGNNYHPLSSGQLTFFKFSLLCSLYIENGSFVLLDEPETHLHPNLISEFVDLLDNILEKTGSYAIVATHSAYFVREVSREQVHVFKVDENNNVSISNPRLRTFGASVDAISEFVFEDGIESRLTRKIIERMSDQSFSHIDEVIGDEVSLSALMTIRSYVEGGKH